MAKFTSGTYGDLAVIPFQAYAPMRERLEWLTEVFNSHNGTEQRQQLRAAARTTLAYDFTEQAWLKSEGYNTERGALRRNWAVPLWSQLQLVGAVTGGATNVVCDTDIYDFRDDGLAMLYQSETQYQIVTITAVNVGSIDITAATAFTRAYVMPVRIGTVRGDIVRVGNGHNAKVSATFELTENLEVSSSAPTQFLSFDLNTDEVLLDGDVYETQLSSQEDIADYMLGPIAKRAPWTYTRSLMNHARVLEGQAEVYAFRQFLARRAGKYREFWQPTFENDLRKNGTGAITTTFKFYKDSFLDWNGDRLHVAFEDNAGVWYPRTLSSVSAFDSTTLQATLNASLGVSYENLRRISYLGLKRLSSDTVDLSWVGNSVAKVVLGVTELQP
jgi:hypothetical protein